MYTKFQSTDESSVVSSSRPHIIADDHLMGMYRHVPLVIMFNVQPPNLDSMFWAGGPGEFGCRSVGSMGDTVGPLNGIVSATTVDVSAPYGNGSSVSLLP